MQDVEYDGTAFRCKKSPCTLSFAAIGDTKNLFWSLGNGTYVKGSSAKPTYSSSGSYSVVLYRGADIVSAQKIDDVIVSIPSGAVDLIANPKERELFLSVEQLFRSVQEMQKTMKGLSSANTIRSRTGAMSGSGVKTPKPVTFTGRSVSIENAKSVSLVDDTYVCRSKKSPCSINLKYSGGDPTGEYEWNF